MLRQSLNNTGVNRETDSLNGLLLEIASRVAYYMFSFYEGGWVLPCADFLTSVLPESGLFTDLYPSTENQEVKPELKMILAEFRMTIPPP